MLTEQSGQGDGQIQGQKDINEQQKHPSLEQGIIENASELTLDPEDLTAAQYGTIIDIMFLWVIKKMLHHRIL